MARCQDLGFRRRHGLHEVFLRPLQPSDAASLKRLHDEIFPVNYDDAFFDAAAHRKNGVLGWAACVLPHEAHRNCVETDGNSNDDVVVGFITVRELVGVDEIPSGDCVLLGMDKNMIHDVRICYILTLGVAAAYRQQGIASQLLNLLENYAYQNGCQAIYLHVIDYNDVAKNFYTNSGFEKVVTLHKFYHIATGRAKFPDVTEYDAAVFVKGTQRLVITDRNRDELSIPMDEAVPFPLDPFSRADMHQEADHVPHVTMSLSRLFAHWFENLNRLLKAPLRILQPKIASTEINGGRRRGSIVRSSNAWLRRLFSVSDHNL